MARVSEGAPVEPSLSLREAAERLGVSARSVRRYVRSGQLEAIQVVGRHGPEYRVPEAALGAYLSTVARVPSGKARLGGATIATATVDTLAMVATQLDAERSATREAWLRAEAAWSRVAELEAELATLLATLQAGTPAPAPARRSLLGRLRGR
jgi:excisionase family DNA binding protein